MVELEAVKKDTAIGLFVSDSTPSKVLSSNKSSLVLSYFAFACMYGINFFMFSPTDVDWDNNTVDGVFLKDGEFVRLKTPLPAFVFWRWGNPLDKKFNAMKKRLKKSCYQVYRYWNDKNKFTSWLLQGKYADYAIETRAYEDGAVNDFLARHNSMILKPIFGQKGKGIYKVEKQGKDTVMVSYLEDKKEMKLEDFIAQNHDTFTKNQYTLQPFVDSTTLEGAPMDIRLCMARGAHGEWCATALYFRFGGVGNVTTNTILSTRSRSPYVLQGLSHQLGKKEGRRLYNEILNIQKNFPEYYQNNNKECKNFIIPEIALDIGIDRNNGNQLKFFEVGFTPGSAGIDRALLASTNMQFFKYLMSRG